MITNNMYRSFFVQSKISSLRGHFSPFFSVSVPEFIGAYRLKFSCKKV